MGNDHDRIALAGDAIMIVAAFMPIWARDSVDTSARHSNSLLQAGVGGFFLMFALIDIRTTYRVITRGATGPASLVVGLAASIYTIYIATNDDTLSYCPSHDLSLSCQRGQPGTGIAVAGAGALLLTAAGLLQGWQRRRNADRSS